MSRWSICRLVGISILGLPGKKKFFLSSLHKSPLKKVTRNNNYSVTTNSDLPSFLSHADSNGRVPNCTDSATTTPLPLTPPPQLHDLASGNLFSTLNPK